VAGRQGGAAAPWRSYHIFLDGPLEPYLVEHFEARLRSEITARRVRRFFFLRFGKGKGAHLRLRFLPGEGFAERRLEDAIRGAARQYAGRRGVVRPGFVLERHPYCRSCLYFGDNNLSVYSELLNEATSWLALGLMHSLGPERRAERWVVAACLSASIVHRAVRDRGAADRLLQRAASFARRAAAEYGLAPTRQGAVARRQRAGTLCVAERRVAAAFDGDAALARVVRVARRIVVARMGARFVLVHGIHLLWNKLGFDLSQEYEAFAAVLMRRTREPAETTQRSVSVPVAAEPVVGRQGGRGGGDGEQECRTRRTARRERRSPSPGEVQLEVDGIGDPDPEGTKAAKGGGAAAVLPACPRCERELAGR